MAYRYLPMAISYWLIAKCKTEDFLGT